MDPSAAKALARSFEAVDDELPEEFSLHRVIDAGGQGVVHQGTYRGLACALKVYFPGQVQTRIDREVNALGRLECDAVVRLLWSGEVVLAGCRMPVVATEFVDGRTLSEVLRRGAQTAQQLTRIGHDVALAVEHLWALRIVHRDLKPSNVMVRPDGRACVIDLGVARHVDEATLTSFGVTWGTRGYMSPEQTRAVRQLTCKSDLFALGVILIECGLGHHPTGRDQARLLGAGYHDNLPAPLSAWEHAGLLRAVLSPKPIIRPSPNVVIDVFSSGGI